MLLQIIIVIIAVIMLAITLRFLAFPTLGKRKAIITCSVALGILCALMIVSAVASDIRNEGEIYLDAALLICAAGCIMFSLFNCISDKYTDLARANSAKRPDEPQVKTCKHCHASVAPYSSQCPLCGCGDFDIYYPDRDGYDGSLPIPKPANTEPAPANNGWRCGACGRQNEKDDAFCGSCGQHKP
ncbi:MAG: hypothetical protein J1E39_01330 [Eubacterium sp.]|nr:hypothetical protein [Eubacterium sp.]